MTERSATVFKMHRCNRCDKVFTRRDNLERHMKDKHGNDSGYDTHGEDSESDMSTSREHDSDYSINSPDADSNDSTSVSSNDDYSAEVNIGSSDASADEDTDEPQEGSDMDFYSVDPWIELTGNVYSANSSAAKEHYNAFISSGMSSATALRATFREMKPLYLKDLQENYRAQLRFIERLKKDATHRKIMESIRSKVSDGYDRIEAIDSVVDQRRHLLKRKLTLEMQAIMLEED